MSLLLILIYHLLRLTQIELVYSGFHIDLDEYTKCNVSVRKTKFSPHPSKKQKFCVKPGEEVNDKTCIMMADFER